MTQAKSACFLSFPGLTELVHDGFGVLWFCENFGFKSCHAGDRRWAFFLLLVGQNRIVIGMLRYFGGLVGQGPPYCWWPTMR